MDGDKFNSGNIVKYVGNDFPGRYGDVGTIAKRLSPDYYQVVWDERWENWGVYHVDGLMRLEEFLLGDAIFCSEKCADIYIGEDA